MINIIIPEGTRDRMDIKVGEDNMRICTWTLQHCFKTRVVMTTKKFPGFEASSYPYITYTTPSVIITP